MLFKVLNQSVLISSRSFTWQLQNKTKSGNSHSFSQILMPMPLPNTNTYPLIRDMTIGKSLLKIPLSAYSIDFKADCQLKI